MQRVVPVLKHTATKFSRLSASELPSGRAPNVGCQTLAGNQLRLGGRIGSLAALLIPSPHLPLDSNHSQGQEGTVGGSPFLQPPFATTLTASPAFVCQIMQFLLQWLFCRLGEKSPWLVWRTTHSDLSARLLGASVTAVLPPEWV